MLFNVLVASFGVCLLLYCIWFVGCVGYWFGWLLAGFVWCYLRFLGLGGCYDLISLRFPCLWMIALWFMGYCVDLDFGGRKLLYLFGFVVVVCICC